MHEVRGKDGVGAVMDFMELEREKGITIQSAATFCRWKQYQINLIDTPGHVDFTVEVERSLRVLDGAVLVLCGVGGVQSQTITVDRQMRRYQVPRICFVNKLDRDGANPWRVLDQMRQKLKHNFAAVQVPIGLEGEHQGLVDIIEGKAYKFQGVRGENLVEISIPKDLEQMVDQKRTELVERVADVDDQLAELFLEEQGIGAADLKDAIRRATLSHQFIPVFMGSAFKNKGVQLLLDGIGNYLPSPVDVQNTALDVNKQEEEFILQNSPMGPLVALAFKLEEGRYGQLTYLRIYSGKLKRGSTIYNASTWKKVKVPRLVRTHSNELEDIDEAFAGDIVALFGVECASGDTFTDGSVRFTMTSIKVPDPVVSLALWPKDKQGAANFSKALNRFQKEDPTFHVSLDPETAQTIIKGMGELHLEIYIERIKREYNVDCDTGKPKVSYRETITKRAEFDYLHKKQSGGAGQFAAVAGYIEPLPDDHPETNLFVNGLVGSNIPPEFVPAIEKGFNEAMNAGHLIGHPIQKLKFVILDGKSHPVDSNELAFRLATLYAFRQAYMQAYPQILEPVMQVEVRAPNEYQGAIMGDINKRRGIIKDCTTEIEDVVIDCLVPLNDMFGYSNSLRSATSGKGEFSMEYSHHAPVPANIQEELTSGFVTNKK
eukprot:TRINITY_DN5292_c1_g1_i2.p1 TRINITY_DN5292_c1_g1~~TRINITY_DN5292_c1_g1_i2.p1  ORF type:complete len:659 (-),score=72.19 TRINITY_DN5292_c1_g1_i2:223-2199(-)